MSTASACLPLYTPVTASKITTKTSTSRPFSFNTRKFNGHGIGNSITCRAASFQDINIDLYDLLGIDNSSDQSQIKTAYRTLQKRCHPDIAGPAGHDMAVILNEVYSLLSDPTSRSAYDKEQSKIAQLRGFTGKPLYSVWFGGESENRAVFVDEVKCVGCLKCALCAEKTFAIESVYGRARVVGQWADPEYKIQEAIQACPVDCISIVERSDLAALEYLMSKQPRGNVRVGANDSVGARVSNIFVDVKKFQTKYFDAMNKAATKEEDMNWKARMSAIQAIRSISNWFYWQSPTSKTDQNLTHISQKTTDPNIKKLRAAAAARKHAREIGTRTKTPSNYIYLEEYWSPSTQALPAPAPVPAPAASTHFNSSSGDSSEFSKKKTNEEYYREENRRSPIARGIPIVTAAIAAGVVRMQVGEGVVGGLKEHIGGSLALDIVNSSWLQVILAGITWYYVGVGIVELIETTGNRQE
ncbi:chaperone protein dnaJ C76, chloroplastic-like [Pistacia vera]|uniref:chaperone protein dnaJ C76, chloroplastic-like n=1 Tax=Pistacia vera TaxID=55513 RepID=UPI0012630DC4|nr:chaperone protein dnaJ C76, chloroplastic-like [Pistacia vera]XP_031272351.1 chaperone protein dnaJ C76, chloroplastic-like [Pistacia vera]